MSTQIIASASEKTMSSREIAVLTEKLHGHVRRDIISMLISLEIDASKFGATYIDSLGRQQEEFLLPYDETVCLLTGYDVGARMSVIKRWKELESQTPVASFNIPTTLSGALRLAAEQADTIEAQAKQLTSAQPHIAFVEKYVDASGSKGFRQVCKLLNVNETDFRVFLVTRNIMYRLGGEWTPCQRHIDAGRFEVKAGTAHLSNHAFNQARFTPKGVTWIAGEWAKFQLNEQVAA